MCRLAMVFCASITLIASAARPAAAVDLALDPSKVLNPVDEKIYGHFLEHIYHSVNGGLWGEMIWDRSFEGGSRVPVWKPYGPGKATISLENPLNCSRCELITGDQGETGVAQQPLCIRAGETYGGSVWARGSAEGLVVRLLDGNKMLAEKTLPPPGEKWQESKFDLQPAAAADNATIQVGVRGKARVFLDQVSLMPDASLKTGGFRPDLLKAIADLRPPVIRWPGGCFASYYRWKDGIGPQHQRVRYPQNMWDDVDPNSFGTDEFIRMCRAVKAEPIIVVNIGMHDAKTPTEQYCREACDWLEYCNGAATTRWGKVRAANGHPDPYDVKYWEIDNEVWKLKPEQYVKIVRQFAPAMKKADPSIKLIACGSGQLGHFWPTGDAAVLEGCSELINYLSVHHYEDPKHLLDGPARAEKFWRSRGELIAKAPNPQVKLFVSEWNLQTTDWRTGLYAGAALNLFERCGDCVGMAAPALFLRHVYAQAWDNAFINFDHRTWFPAPNYVVMKLWREHYAPQRIALTGDAGPLDVVATKSDDGRTLICKTVNPTDKAVPVRVAVGGGFLVGKAEMQVVAPGSPMARNSLDKPHAIRPEPGRAEVIGQTVAWTMPPFSAAVVTIEP